MVNCGVRFWRGSPPRRLIRVSWRSIVPSIDFIVIQTLDLFIILLNQFDQSVLVLNWIRFKLEVLFDYYPADIPVPAELDDLCGTVGIRRVIEEQGGKARTPAGGV